MEKIETYGFLFDNDGVLIDSEHFHWLSWVRLMEKEGNFFLSKETFLQTFGKRNDLILQQVLPDASPEKREQLALQKEAFFRDEAKGKIQLLEGMEAFLKDLKKRHVPRIIASSTPIANLKMFLSSTVLGSYFDSFVSAEEVAHGKPFPDVFLEAAKRLKLPPQQCIVLEDAPVGIEAGKKAGCFVVALATTHCPENLTRADLIYPSPSALNFEEILQKWKKNLSQ